jgi:HD-GYP domain-containing protein (c-di-GMP phosphodiesterase class II)
MFIAELDRPWLETPFVLQGFVVRNTDDILFVSNHVDHVYVDAEYAGDRRRLRVNTKKRAKPPARLALKKDFKRAQVSFDTAAVTLNKIFDSLRSGNESDISAVKTAINPLIESVFRNAEAVAALLRLRDSGEYRYHHGLSMAVWAAILGRHMGLSRNELEKLAVGCAMCDIGMTQLPSQLLEQEENLTDAQRRIIRAHPTIGAELISQSGGVDLDILGIIENHHERIDGSGYPRGIKGTAIPLLARIAGLVDTYDAMISSRPYASVRTSYDATQELLDSSGQLFQAALVEQFVQAIGLFPTGSLVELNTGEVAIVVSQNITRRLKPELLIVLNAAKERLAKSKTVILANQHIAAEGERWITRELKAGTYGISGEEFFI